MHHERRLHHLLLLEELKAWEQQYVAQAVTPTHGASTHGSTVPTSNGHSALPPASTAGSAAAAATDAYAAQAAAVAAAAAAVTADAGLAAPAFGRTSIHAGTPVIAAAGPVGLPPRAPSPAPASAFAGGANAAPGASTLQAEGSGNLANSGISAHGYTSAGFPQADEGGAACPHGAAGTGSAGANAGLGAEASGGFAAAPAGPFDEGPHLGRCGSNEGPLGALGVHGVHGLGVSEPLIDVGLDLPAAVQLQEQGALCMDRRRSTAGPGGLPAVVGPDGIPLSPQATADGTVFGRAPPGGGAGASGEIQRATSSNALTGMGSGGGGLVAGSAVVGVPPGLPPLMPSRQTSTRTMTVTGEEGETGQAVPPPAPTAVPPSLGGAAVSTAEGGPAAALTGSAGGAAQDQLAPLRRSEVRIQHSTLLNYWLVTIRCRDRNKLFFDTVSGGAAAHAAAFGGHSVSRPPFPSACGGLGTQAFVWAAHPASQHVAPSCEAHDHRLMYAAQVCTLADMNYDIYHATIDSEGDAASQLFYVRPR